MVGGKIYALGGIVGSATDNDNEEYDPVSNTWATRADLPSKRQYLTSSVVGDKIYVIGGNNTGSVNRDKNEEYDPASNTWVTRASMPIARYRLASSVIGHKIYVIGGFNGSQFNTNEEYDPAINTWTTKADMLTSRDYLATAVAGGKIYAIGGVWGGDIKTNEEYDPGTDTWVTKADMPTARSGLAAASVGGKIYAFGGSDYSANEEYDPVANTWSTKSSMITARNYMGSAVASGKIYLIGGDGGTTKNEVYDPGVSYKFTGSDFDANEAFTFYVKARNQHGMETQAVSTTVYTAAYPPSSAVSTFTAVSSAAVTVAWDDNGNAAAPVNAVQYLIDVSTVSAFNATDDFSTDWMVEVSTYVANLNSNTTYYFKVKARNSDSVETAYHYLGSTITHIEMPASIYIDELYPSTITISAYASSFTNLKSTGSGINFSSGTAFGWAGWSVTADSWTMKTDMPTARTGLTASMVGGKIYALGGIVGSATDNDNEEYDPVSNTWATRADLPSKRQYLTSSVVGDKIYVIGGNNTGSVNRDKNEEYDPASNTWVTRASMPIARYRLASSVIGHKIYVIGGFNGSQFNTNEEYDPAINTWTTKADMLTSRDYLATAVAGGKIYAIGGVWGGDIKTNEEYDPGTDTWVTKADMPTARSGLAAASVGGKIYAFGGSDYSANEEYDPVANTWSTKSSMITARNYMGSAVASGKIYLIGGDGGTTKNEVYDPGVSYKFTGSDFDANEAFTFYVKARNQHGMETQAVSTTVYTAAYAPSIPLTVSTFTAVSSVAVTVAWDANGNDTAANAANYLVDVSTVSSFQGADDFSTDWITEVSTHMASLTPHTTYYFKVKARNNDSIETAYHNLGSTLTLTVTPENLVITSVFKTSITATWDSLSPTPDKFIVEASSTNFDGTDVVKSSEAENMDLTSLIVESLTENTTYYVRAGALWNDTTGYTSAIATSTLIEDPMRIFIDDLRPSSVTISGYAPTLTNLFSTGSVMNFAIDGIYQSWSVTPGSWTSLANMITARYALTCSVVGGRIYAIGGIGSAQNENEEYDPVTNSWDTRKNMPTARRYLASAVVNNKIYAVGGYNGSVLDVNEEYDPAANSWATRAPMPIPRHSLAVSAVNNKIYALGGYNGLRLNTNEEYDPSINAWTSRSSANLTERYGVTSVVLDNKVHVLGGKDGQDPHNEHESYDPVTDAWSTLHKEVLTQRYYLTSQVVGGKIYAIGGVNVGLSTNLDAMEVYDQYDPAVNAWDTQAWTIMDPLQIKRGYPGSAAVNGKIYIIGGLNGAALNSTMEFDPGVSYQFTSLSPNTQYTFSVKARNQYGIETQSISISSYTAAYAPIATASTFTNVFATSMTVSWSDNSNPSTVEYYLEGSTASIFNGSDDFALGWASYPDMDIQSGVVSTQAANLTANTTYYYRVKARNLDYVETAYWNLGSTVTNVETPVSIYIDELSTKAVTISAYAALFTNLKSTGSGINFGIGTADPTWQGWTVTADSWTVKADMLTARAYLAGTALNGRIYAMGGSGQSENEEYDPATNSWITRAALSGARLDFAAAAVGSKIYAIGGFNATDLNEEYDPVANSWETKAPMPTGRHYATGTAVRGKIYVIGGTNGSTLNANEEYDPAANVWVTRMSVPTARHSLSGAVVDNKIYVIGGINGSALNANEEYDPVANTWATKASMPTSRYLLTSAAAGRKIYSIGGYDELTTNEEYDPASNTWTTKTSMLAGRNAMTSVSVAGKIYLIGGVYGTALKTVEEYNPGVSYKFSDLTGPDTLYTFSVKARNRHGMETQAISTYVYTAANPPAIAEISSFTNVYATSVTVSWSENNNPATVQYYLEASTESVFIATGNVNTGWTADIFSSTPTGLTPNSTYYFMAKARNSDSVETVYHNFGSTTTLAQPPVLPYTFPYVFTSSIVASWNTPASGSGGYLIEASSTDFDGTDTVYSTETLTGSLAILTMENLTFNTTYYFKGRSYNRNLLLSSYTAMGATATVAEAPEAPFIFEEIYPASVTVSWRDPAYFSGGFLIQASTASDFNEYADLFSSSTYVTSLTTLTVMGLSGNATYYFRGASYNWNLELSSYSVMGSTLTEVSYSPQNLLVSEVLITSITASWDPLDPGPDSYILEASSMDFDATATVYSSATISTNVVTLTVESLTPNTTYYLRSGAVWSGETFYSNSISTPTFALPPVAPFFFTAVYESSVTVAWEAPVGGANGYIIEASSKNFDGESTVYSSATLVNSAYSITVENLHHNTTYYFRGASYNWNLHLSSYAVIGSTLSAMPKYPSGGTISSVFVSSVGITWTALDTAPDKYLVVASSTNFNGGASYSSATTNTDVTALTIESLTPNTSYYLKVGALWAETTSYVSFDSTATLAEAPYGPFTFTGVHVTSVAISWDEPSDGVNGYRIQASSTDFDGTGTIISSKTLVDSLTTLTIVGLAEYTTYYFKGESYNWDMARSSYSVMGSTLTYPDTVAPTWFSGTVAGASSITWAWTDVTGELHYRVVTSTGWDISGDLGPDTTYWAETSLSTNTLHGRRVMVSYGGRTVISSETINVYTLTAPPTGFAFTEVNITSAVVSWGANTNPTGTNYRLDKWTVDEATTSVTVDVTSATLTRLVAGTTYYLRVHSINGDSLLSAVDADISTVTVGNIVAQENVTAAESKTITYIAPSGEVNVIITPNTFTEDVQVTVQVPQTVPEAISPTADLYETGVVVEIVLDKAIQPVKNVDITLTYLDADVVGMDENKLIVARYDSLRLVWVPLASVTDPVNNRVTGKTNHFSMFQVMQLNPSASVGAVKVFPNPFRPGRGHQVMNFSNLPANAKLRIYTLLGELVRELKTNSSGLASWDGKNKSGYNAASGVYFVHLEAIDGKKVIKVVIQR
ncbi:fibronectin type III domain-containing protein [Elusimicrobiota bacterium]